MSRARATISVLVLLLAAMPSAALAAGTTERVSVSATGRQGDGPSFFPALSGDGRYVAFESDAADLVPNDANGAALDVFVRDRKAGTTTLASVAPSGASGDRQAIPSPVFISRDGRHVAFGSDATDLVPGDTNGNTDVFVRDRKAGATRRASVGSGGRQADGYSYPLAISASGRFVVFASGATNLVPGTPDSISLYVRDLRTGATTLESRRPDGEPSGGLVYGGASITPDGRYLAFASSATDLVPQHLLSDSNVFLRDRRSGKVVLVSVASDGTPGDDRSFHPFVSDDGRLVAFDSAASNLVPGDTNGNADVFVRDLAAGATRLVSVGRGGRPAKGSLGGSVALGLSADGRLVLFASGAPNLVSGDTNYSVDTFVRDRATGVTTRVDLRASGGQSDRGSYGDGAISADGRVVAFSSDGNHLVPGDTNGATDVFVRVPGGTATGVRR